MTPGGIVLAGGAGRRLGGTGKATVEVGGVALAERAVEALRRADCEDIVVVSRPEVPLPRLDVAVVHDGAGPGGPLNALRTGLIALTNDDVLVLACDLPLAGPLVGRLARLPPGTIAVAVDAEGRRQPLCGRYPRLPALTAAEAATAAGEQRMTAWLDRLGVEPHEEPARGDELLNVNEPGDLARARRTSTAAD